MWCCKSRSYSVKLSCLLLLTHSKRKPNQPKLILVFVLFFIFIYFIYFLPMDGATEAICLIHSNLFFNNSKLTNVENENCEWIGKGNLYGTNCSLPSSIGGNPVCFKFKRKWVLKSWMHVLKYLYELEFRSKNHDHWNDL